MTKKFFINLWEHAFAFAAPTATTLIIWLMTFGSFNLIGVLNDPIFVTFYSMYSIFVMLYVYIKTCTE